MSNKAQMFMWIGLALIATTFDALATLVAIRIGGLYEANPLVNFWLQKGIFPLLGYKWLIILAIPTIWVVGDGKPVVACRNLAIWSTFLYFGLAFYTLILMLLLN